MRERQPAFFYELIDFPSTRHGRRGSNAGYRKIRHDHSIGDGIEKFHAGAKPGQKSPVEGVASACSILNLNRVVFEKFFVCAIARETPSITQGYYDIFDAFLKEHICRHAAPEVSVT
jgi:hypothetical protein